MSTGFLIFPVGYAPTNDGAVVPGGKLYFYRTGTSTLQNTYNVSTLGGGNENSNPIVLNSEGRLDTLVYGDPTTGFNYRVRLTDANDVQIWSFDDMTGDVDDTRLSSNVALFTSNNLTFSGTLNAPNASAAELGFKGYPQNSQSGDYTAVMSDAGKMLYQTGTGRTFTIPANASVAFPIGTRLLFINAAASGNLLIAITTDTMYLANAAFGTTGTRTLARGAVAEAIKLVSNQWIIYSLGGGLT